MSMFSYPTELSADAMKKQMDAMNGWMKTADLDVPPLFAHPAGAFAAATALGIGVAGHMTGLMLGAMQGAMKMQAEAMAMPGELFGVPPEEAFVEAPVARKKAATTAEVVPIKPAAIEAVETAEPVETAPKKTVKPASKAAKVTRPAEEAPAAKVAAMDKLKSDADMAAAASVETAVAEAPVEIKAPATAAPVEAKPVLEPEDFRRPAEMEKPATPDDLKAISGIGPKLEQVLNSLGIWTYEQVAAWNEAEIAWLDDYLQFKGRIDRDGWIGQAAEFAKGSKA